MPPDTILPPGLVPRYLSREVAAAYVGVSAVTFDAEVREGWWPGPRARGAKGTRRTWDRLLLDAAADRHSGLRRAAEPGHATSGETDAQQAAEDAAIKGVQDAARRHRAKHRHQKAA